MSSEICKEAKRKSEVTIQMEELSDELQRLRELLDTLENRLSNVLRLVPEKDPSDCMPPEKNLPPLASQLKDRCDNVKACYAITQKIIDRLEN